MKKTVISIVLLILAQSANAGVYCTSNNWDKLSALFGRMNKEHKQVIQDINEYEIKTTSSEFIHNRYTLEKYRSMWNMNNDVDRKSVERFITSTEKQLTRIVELSSQLQRVKKDARNLEHNWKKLADYCYNEDNFKSYERASRNHELSSNHLKAAKELIAALKETKENYVTELDFFMKTKAL